MADPSEPNRGAVRARAATRWRVVAAGLVLAACAASRPTDPLALRCGEALEYLLSDWSELQVVHARRTGGGLAVRLRVEGLREPSREPATEFASCAFEPGARPSALRVVVGGRSLDPKELALVNAELLLRDLGRGSV